MFHGEECPHCQAMHPIVDKLIKEGINIEKFEVWHNENNADDMRKFSEVIIKACGGDLGVPVFLDKENDKVICGEISYIELKKWINKR